MKLLVLSDTHGRIDKALAACEKHRSADLVIHLGDMVSDAVKIAKLTGCPMVNVKGNNDFVSGKEDFRILETEYGNLLLTHGHKQNVKNGLQGLLYKTEELNCKAALFGHTHVPLFIESKGIYLLNPGSLTFPAAGTSGTYAVIEISKNEFTASIFS